MPIFSLNLAAFAYTSDSHWKVPYTNTSNSKMSLLVSCSLAHVALPGKGLDTRLEWFLINVPLDGAKKRLGLVTRANYNCRLSQNEPLNINQKSGSTSNKHRLRPEIKISEKKHLIMTRLDLMKTFFFHFACLHLLKNRLHCKCSHKQWIVK